MRPVDLQLSPATLEMVARCCDVQQGYLGEATRFLDGSCSRVHAFSGALIVLRSQYRDAYETASRGLRRAQEQAAAAASAVDLACQGYQATDERAAELTSVVALPQLPPEYEKLHSINSKLGKIQDVIDKQLERASAEYPGSTGTAHKPGSKIDPTLLLEPTTLIAQSLGVAERLRELHETNLETVAYQQFIAGDSR